MKKAPALVALLTLILAPSQAQERSAPLPKDVRRLLDRNFSNWKFVKIHPEVEQFVKKQYAGSTRPDLIKGDFDGNGQTDYAVYIVYGQPRSRKIGVIAFLRKGRRIKFYVLRSDPLITEDEITPTESYLNVEKKGTRCYNYDTGRFFRFVNDTISFSYFEKGGSSYIYRNGKFRPYVTSD